ncbi:MAG: ribbon-helix-helix domain-containing protein [Candidatus Bathyarchaeia archaeon]
MGRKRQITFTLDEELVKEMEKVREETGLPISTQIELKLKGYKVVKEKAT